MHVQTAELTTTLCNWNRYLVVIEDVWTIEAWETIKYKLLPTTHNNNCRSRIIVTTQDKTLAEACSIPSNIHYMEPLNLEDSKKLFVSIAFGKMDASYPEEFEELMLDILEKLCGVPLAIIRSATILAGYTSSYSRDKWKTICKSICSQLQNNPTFERLMRRIATLSYDHLPHELKGCMMFLSIFPKDYKINRNRLLVRWITEGLIPEKRGLTLLEVAEYYFDELVRRNMLKATFDERDCGKVESCQVHGVLLEVLVSKSLESSFVSLLGGQYAGMSYDRIRRLSIHEVPVGSSYGIELGIMDDAVHHVRSLSVFHSTTVPDQQFSPVRPLMRLDYNLHKFVMLRVLDLEDYKGLESSHMICICRLHLLKFLNLKGTDIRVVPPQVGRLEHLQTFDIRDTDLDELPDSLIKLEKLECLQFSSNLSWNTMWKLPRGLRKMKALRVVTNAVLPNDIVVAREVGKLRKLQEIVLYIDSYTIGDNMEVLQELARSLGRMYSLRSLHIGDLGWTSSILEFLHDLPAPPRLLRFLRITGEIGGRLPNWIGALTNLVVFAISWVDLSGDDEPFGIICKLPNLRSVDLGRRYYTGNKLVARTCHNFPALLNLTMTCCEHDDPTPGVFQFEAGAMSKLETLVLDFQDYYEKSIRGIEHLRNLREVRIIGKKGNPAVYRALEELKCENELRTEYSNRFRIIHREM
jgi:disease resistance protein RPM1